MILILEDSPERVRRFERALRGIDPSLKMYVWRDAPSMIREIGTHLAAARLISLDHDLMPLDDGSDPGDGLQVTHVLVTQPTPRPVIVHTSNAERAAMMMGELELARWPRVRVAPVGEDWIEHDWTMVVRRFLASAPDA